MPISRQELLSLARQGAIARIAELEAEIASIQKKFQNLGGTRRGPGRPPGATSQAAPTKRRRRRMSREARKRISEMMKKRWAERRKAQK